MEEQVAQLLAATQDASQTKQAEQQLLSLYTAPGFPLALTSVASHDSIPLSIRQAALLSLKNFVQAAWSPEIEQFQGQVLVSNEDKERLRPSLLNLALNDRERKIRNAASYVVSKVGSVDFPEEWPGLLRTTLDTVQTGNDDQLGGALKVLNDLVDESFNEEQFFGVARELIQAIFDVATNDSKPPFLRALAVKVFRPCCNILEMLMGVDEHKQQVKAFAEEALTHWIPFFVQIMKSALPDPPSEEEEQRNTPTAEAFRGLVALKMQVVKVLMAIRSVFPTILAPQSPTLFSATWDELSTLQKAYHHLYIENERQGRLEADNNLPYTLDFLVLEELDFMQACLRAQPVRKELEAQLDKNVAGENSWVAEVMKLAVAYAQITTEDEALWVIDVNIFISEATGTTYNYTPRQACGELTVKLGEWLQAATVEGILAYTRTLYTTNQSWKAKEAVLYLLDQLLLEFEDDDKKISSNAANGFTDFARYAIQQPDEFLRARGYLVAGNLLECSEDGMEQNMTSFMEDTFQATLQALNNDDSEVVKAACIRALQSYIKTALSKKGISVGPMQIAITNALSNYIAAQDLQELANESDDLLTTLVETLRNAILMDPGICLAGNGLDLLFSVANYGPHLFNVTSLITETFDTVAKVISSKGSEPYAQLCAKVLPSLTGAFHVSTLTETNDLTILAAELLAILARHGSEPLPNGFVASVMPKLNHILLQSNMEELLKTCTSAVNNMLIHDYKQLFEWRDESGKGGLEVVLIIIDRLLGPSVDDNAAAEVGGLAAEVVEKAGPERLGPYLMQLLRVVAIRLCSATQAAFIQSLILVFARLSLVNVKDVVEFLAQVQVGDKLGLEVVVRKWLENSVNFAGYDEIRQNVIALSKLFELGDPRLSEIQVQGDLVIPQDDRIMTRSRTKLQPDQYTIVPANLKIIKVLVEELHSASSSRRDLEAAALNQLPSEDGSDDDQWEDDPDFLNLSSPATKLELMGYADDSPLANRQPDNETQAYLIQFFRNAASKPGFAELFGALTPSEQEKLGSFGNMLV